MPHGFRNAVGARLALCGLGRRGFARIDGQCLRVGRIRCRARNSGGHRLRPRCLVGALHGESRRLVWIVDFRRLIGGRFVVVERDRSAHVARAGHRLERRDELVLQRLLGAQLHCFRGLRAQGQVARRVHQHHVIRSQSVDRRGDQIANRLRLAVGQRAAPQLEHDRRLGRPLLALKKRIVRQHQMHARRLHIGKRCPRCARARLRELVDNSPARRTPTPPSSACRRSQNPAVRSSRRPWPRSRGAPCPVARREPECPRHRGMASKGICA